MTNSVPAITGIRIVYTSTLTTFDFDNRSRVMIAPYGHNTDLLIEGLRMFTLRTFDGDVVVYNGQVRPENNGPYDHRFQKIFGRITREEFITYWETVEQYTRDEFAQGNPRIHHAYWTLTRGDRELEMIKDGPVRFAT